MTKVMYLPLNFGDVVMDGVYNAFREVGCELSVFDYMSKHVSKENNRNIREQFIAEARRIQPDLIHMQIQHTTVLDADCIRKVKNCCPNTKMVNWTGDVRNYVPPQYKKIAEIADFNLISSTGQIDFFSKTINKPVQYWQIGYNPELYHPAANPPPKFQYDIVFTGHNDAKEKYPGAATRAGACKILRNQFKSTFGLFGCKWPRDLVSSGSIDQRKIMGIYHNSVCCLSISHYNDLNHYFSDRLLMCLASGRPTICFRFPKWETYFTDMADLVIVDSIEQIPDKVRMLKNDPELANFIGRQGAAKVFAEHTYQSRIKELLQIVGLGV